MDFTPTLTDDQVRQEAQAYVEEHFEDLVADVTRLVSARSVEEPDKAGPGAPWGPGPRQALDIAISLLDREGLVTKDCDGYIGWGDLPGILAVGMVLVFVLSEYVLRRVIRRAVVK